MRRDEVLIEALPYIREFHDSVMVIKIGGHAMADYSVMESVIQDVILLRYIGVHPVIVHGGGPEIDEKMRKFGKKPEFIHGIRVTDEETLEIARMVLVGNINSKIVSLISKYGEKGVGLSGKDGMLIVARKKEPKKMVVDGKVVEVDYGFVGEIERINPEIVSIMLENEYIPVISPIAVDKNGNNLNINADTVAGELAGVLKAKKLISMTDVDGLMKNPKDPSTLIRSISLRELEEMMESGSIQGGMIPKCESIIRALKGGVEKGHIINGAIPHALLLELFTDEGIGTMVYKD
ncbi:MAG: acetylglutamate kinase [Archaeoglobi archaeon]|nr:acetylglutamate kinase [Candidatus Mnemosynella sp.]